jgi:hypothetical protein
METPVDITFGLPVIKVKVTITKNRKMVFWTIIRVRNEIL